jgi:hypothetical protein
VHRTKYVRDGSTAGHRISGAFDYITESATKCLKVSCDKYRRNRQWMNGEVR